MHATSSTIPGWAWGVFFAVTFVGLAVDLLAHRGAHDEPRGAAIGWSVAWVGVGVLFGVGVLATLGGDAAEEYFGAYLLEKSLSADNLFVFYVIFGSLQVPRQQQRRVLSWGVFGALLTRGVFIGAGITLIERFHWLIYGFGALLVVTAVRLLVAGDAPEGEGRLLRWLRRYLPTTSEPHGAHFFAREGGSLRATPLLLALVTIELSDVLFAFDSIPAVFAITEHPFIVYSSNILAVLGLRALYLVIAEALGHVRYLRYGLAAVLVVAGTKMIASRWVHLPPPFALGAIVVCVGASVGASVWADRRDRRAKAHVG